MTNPSFAQKVSETVRGEFKKLRAKHNADPKTMLKKAGLKVVEAWLYRG